ncbi:Ig-like domain-containing protein [Gemmata sp. JC673]|uniref:Ig-like domain-containing protein n=1 Tax=Gemmata algarum TaxID=2975278 RepID=A0ABU5EZC5_9BACT|nr:SdrD B-like domain-containing protein [Gemmata algarum]MDY3559962.1 Ig-like domain-containing protein [Gemmata algarum]
MAIFPDGSSGRAFVNQAVTIGGLKLGGTSTARVALTHTLTVTTTFDQWGGTLADGALVLGTGAKGSWQGGTIAAASLTIAPNAQLEVWNTGRRILSTSTLKVQGTLWWNGGDVQTVGASEVRVQGAGRFKITAANATFGSGGSFTVVNDANGLVTVDTAARATLGGDYRTAGATVVENGTLKIAGTAKQTASSGRFLLFSWSAVEVPTDGLRILDGSLGGDGIVRGNLSLADETENSGAMPAIRPFSLRIGKAGTIRVEGNFHMYRGGLEIDIYGPNLPGGYDRIEVVPGAGGGGNVSLAGPAGSERVLVATLAQSHAALGVNDVIGFLTYTSRVNGGDFTIFDGVADDPNWSKGQDASKYWLKPNVAIGAVKGKLGGRVWRDDEAVAGVFEPGDEAVLAGRTVRLFDEAGTTLLASTITDVNGQYLFDNLDVGTYVVEFNRPGGERFAAPDVGGDDALDSDPDPLSGRVVVSVAEDQLHIDAGFYYNAAPIAVDDTYTGHINTTVPGAVLLNDTDADADPLTAALASGPAHGTVALSPDGSFVYTPNTSFTGTDSFTYTVTDGFGGTDSGLVTITVSGAPPVGTADSYSAPAELWVPAVSGVLSNDTAPNGPLTAVLVTGPSHGTLVLNSDGSFLYTPDDEFTGTDTFTYRPTDAGGPGEPVAVQITVTDAPPEAVNDTATTSEGAAVVVDVLDNDTDPDSDPLTVAGASDGLYGTTTVNPDGTITYTPGADFNGTDVFTYVIDDGHGRFSYATVTVTVSAVNDNPVATDDAASTYENMPVSVPVLLNDTDADGDALSVTGVTQGAHGTVTFTSAGVTYTPNTGFFGSDTFTYTISDGHGSTDTAAVSVSVAEVGGSGGSGGSIGDFVWEDADTDGIQDPGEYGLYGATVQLLDGLGNVLATTTTDGGGYYSFGGLAAGTYEVQFVTPGGRTASPKDQGTNDAGDSDADPVTGRTGTFTLGANQQLTGIDAGFWWSPGSGGSGGPGDSGGSGGPGNSGGSGGPGSSGGYIGDYVWEDQDHDGVQDAGEYGVSGVTVYLFDGSNNLLATTTTDWSGHYAFSGLSAGSYQVQFVKPGGYTFSPKDQGGNDALDSDADTTTGRSAVFSLSANQQYLDLDAGMWWGGSGGSGSSGI